MTVLYLSFTLLLYVNKLKFISKCLYEVKKFFFTKTKDPDLNNEFTKNEINVLCTF